MLRAEYGKGYFQVSAGLSPSSRAERNDSFIVSCLALAYHHPKSIFIKIAESSAGV